MSLLRARIDGDQTEPLWQAATAVFEQLAAGNIEAAARGLAPASVVLGHEAAVALPALGELVARRGLMPQDLVLLPSKDVENAPDQDIIFAGPVDDGARVGLLQLASQEVAGTVSLGLVFVRTASRAWQVQRIFDPIPFATRAA